MISVKDELYYRIIILSFSRVVGIIPLNTTNCALEDVRSMNLFRLIESEILLRMCINHD